MIEKRLILLLLATLFVCSTAVAQYEQLIKDPEALKAVVEKGGFVKETKTVEPRRLSTPVPHASWVQGMERSNDGEYLLSYDFKSLKIWDNKRRVVISSHSPNEEILKAHFVDDANTVCVITEHGLYFYTDFKFNDKASEKHVRLSGVADAAYDLENKVFYLAIETSKTYASISRYDIAEGTFEPIYKSDFRDFLIKKDPNYVDKRMRQITYSAKYQMLALKFPYRDLFKLIDLRTGKQLPDLDPSKRPYGFLPNGELLSVTRSQSHTLINYINPVTHTLKEVARYPLGSGYDSSWVMLPNNPDNWLIVRGTETTLILNPRDNRTISQKNPVEITTSVIEDPNSEALIFAQALTGNFRSLQISLDQYAAKAGSYLKSWGAKAFLPNSLFARPDQFEFLIQQEFETRRVQITDSGLRTEIVPTPKVLYPRAAFNDKKTGQWFIADSKNPRFIKYDPKSSFETSQAVEIEGPSGFSGIHYFDQTTDGRLQALHDQNDIVVYDTVDEQTILNSKLDINGGGMLSKNQLIAISPQGKYVAYAYVNNTPKEGTWHLTCQNLSNGQILWSNRYIDGRGIYAFDYLKFSDDGSLLYHTGYDSTQLAAIYSTTGELFQKYKLPKFEKYNYNQAGTLAVAWTQDAIRILSLPSGETLAELPIDRLYDQLQFIGSDNFLVGSNRDFAELSLFNIKENKKVAQMYLFENNSQWLVRDPTNGLFASDQSTQQNLYFVQGKQVSPLAAYFDDFYRPRLLGSLIKGLSLESSVDLADLKRAPRVNMKIAGVSQRGLTVEDEFDSFEIEGSEVTLEIKATGEGSPIKDIRIYHNGKLVSGAARGLFVEDDDEWDKDNEEIFTKNSRETFELTPGSNRFRVIAINEQGTESIPDELAVSSASAPAVSEGGIAMHIVVIGVNKYQNPEYDLNYARADAEALEATLAKNNTDIFNRVERYQLYDSEATRENIIATLELVKQNAGPRDAFIFYYAGHGIMSDDNNPQFYIAPHEITQLYGNKRSLSEAAISSDELLKFSRDIAAQKQLFILDACQSAGALKTVAVRGASEEKAIAQLARSSGTHWLTATGSEQFATEFDKLGHGAFTFTLLEALNGAADTGDGIISVNELKAYIEAKVPEVTEEHKGTAQYPASYGYGQDFPISIAE